jgi:hypothetical protein
VNILHLRFLEGEFSLVLAFFFQHRSLDGHLDLNQEVLDARQYSAFNKVE